MKKYTSKSVKAVIPADNKEQFGKLNNGRQVFVLVTRQGGKFSTIHKLVTYEIKQNGSLHYVDTIHSCIANNASYAFLKQHTGIKGYVTGRPTWRTFNNI